MAIDWNILDPNGELESVRQILENTLDSLINASVNVINLNDIDNTITRLNQILDIAISIKPNTDYTTGFINSVARAAMNSGVLMKSSIQSEWIVPHFHPDTIICVVNDSTAIGPVFDESTTMWRWGLISKKTGGLVVNGEYWSPLYDEVIMPLTAIDHNIYGHNAYGMYRTSMGKIYVAKASLGVNNELPDLANTVWTPLFLEFNTALQFLAVGNQLQVAIDKFSGAGFIARKAALDKATGTDYNYPSEVLADLP